MKYPSLLLGLMLSLPSVLAVGEDAAIYSITIYNLLLPIGIFIIIMFTESFSENPFVDVVMRRSLWLLLIYLLMNSAALMFSLNTFAALGLQHELNLYLWFYGWLGYIFMAVIVLKTGKDVLYMYKWQKSKKRMGEDGADGEEA